MIEKSQEKIVVLVIEDEPDAREASRLYLSHCGYDVITAADYDAAFEQANAKPPDVVVCDWRLGAGGDGVEVARKLQQRFNFVLLFVSAYPTDELRTASADLDVTAYFRKPVSLSDLAQTIGQHVSDD